MSKKEKQINFNNLIFEKLNINIETSHVSLLKLIIFQKMDSI